MKSCDLPDTQNNLDTRQIIIDRVGIKDISHPITYIDRDGKKSPTVGNFTMTVTLPENVKGTHMSRFIQILNEVISYFCNVSITLRPEVSSQCCTGSR